MSATVVYWRYRTKSEEEFPTLERALDFAISGEDYGEMWVEEIRDDGSAPKLFVLKDDALREAMREREWIDLLQS